MIVNVLSLYCSQPQLTKAVVMSFNIKGNAPHITLCSAEEHVVDSRPYNRSFCLGLRVITCCLLFESMWRLCLLCCWQNMGFPRDRNHFFERFFIVWLFKQWLVPLIKPFFIYKNCRLYRRVVCRCGFEGYFKSRNIIAKWLQVRNEWEKEMEFNFRSEKMTGYACAHESTIFFIP